MQCDIWLALSEKNNKSDLFTWDSLFFPAFNVSFVVLNLYRKIIILIQTVSGEKKVMKLTTFRDDLDSSQNFRKFERLYFPDKNENIVTSLEQAWTIKLLPLWEQMNDEHWMNESNPMLICLVYCCLKSFNSNKMHAKSTYSLNVSAKIESSFTKIFSFVPNIMAFFLEYSAPIHPTVELLTVSMLTLHLQSLR